MSKRVVEGAKRVSLNCLVSPSTRAAIMTTASETKESQGEVVDRAVALLAFGEEVAAVTARRSKGIEGEARRALKDFNRVPEVSVPAPVERDR